ncbi:UNVERIFIED_ORG: hypothetical protein BCL66_10424 [Martelella mediterranea]
MKYIVLAVAAVMIVVVMFAAYLGISPSSLLNATQATVSKNDGLTSRQYFLRGVEILDEDHPVLVLHEPAAGGELRAVDDPDVLRALAEDSYFSVNPDPIRAPFGFSHVANGYFISLFRDDRRVERWTCEARYCSTSDTPGVASQQSSLQPLLDASRPVTRIFEILHSREDQLRAADAALDDPNVIATSIEARNPYRGASDFGGSFQLQLPTLFVSRDKPAPERLQIAEADVSRMVQQLSAVLDATGLAWEIDGEPALNARQGMLLRHPAEHDQPGAPIIGSDGERMVMEAYEIFSPTVLIAGPEAMYEMLAAGHADDIRTAHGMTVDVRNTIDNAVSQATGKDCNGCWEMALQHDIVGVPAVSHFSEPFYPISYLRMEEKD